MTLKANTQEVKPQETITDKSNRTQLLKKKILEAPYEICIERARYFTQVFKETEGEHPSLRAAKATERTLDNMTIYILPEELLVGNRSSKLVGSPVPLERGEFNIVMELDLKNIIKRKKQSFHITDNDRKELMKELLPYWNKNNVRYFKAKEWKKNDLIRKLWFGPISSLRRFRDFGFRTFWKSVSPLIKGRARHLFKGIRQVSINNPDLVNNCFDVQGHLVLGLNNVIDVGFKKIKEKTIKFMEDNPDGKEFYESVIICCDAIKRFAERFSKLASKMAREEYNIQRKEEIQEIAKIMSKIPWNPP